MTKDKLLLEVQRLIQEGKTDVWPRQTVGAMLDPEYVAKWLGSCRNLISRLGRKAQPWAPLFEYMADDRYQSRVEIRIGSLLSLEHAIQNDMLLEIESLIHAEAMGSLIDQATHLHQNHYHVAAAVLGRCVLEEHLRNLCTKHACTPSTNNPGVNAYNSALYAKQVYDKLKMQLITALATIGNDAAHQGKATKEDTHMMLRDLPSCLALT